MVSRGLSRTVTVLLVAIVAASIIGLALYLGQARQQAPSQVQSTPPTQASQETQAITTATEVGTTTAPPKKTIVTYASIWEMTSPDPSVDFDISLIWMAVVYERLIMYNPYNDSLIPELAVRWEKGSDNLTWTFYLRKDAKFHDGTPVNADAVIFSIMRTKQLGLGPSFVWDAVDRIEKIDDYTVRFHLKYPAPLDLLASASYGAYIFSPRVVEYAGASNATDPKITDWFNAGNDAGSGPYRLVKWDPENEVILEKYPDWWGWRDPNHPFKSSIDKAPDVFIIKIVKDETVQERMLLSGELDIAQNVPIDDISKLKSNPNIVVAMKPGYHNMYLQLNTKKPPLDSVLVRRAIAHAIDYEAIVKALAGTVRRATSFVPYTLWGHADNLTYSYNLTLAKELLAQAGYPNGIDRPLILTYTPGIAHEERTALVIQASLAKIGIRVELKPLSHNEKNSFAQKGWEDPNAVQDMILNDWWATYPSPYDYLWNLFHSAAKDLFAFSYYENKEFEDLIDEAARYEGIDRSVATRLYIEAQKILYNDVPGIPLFDEFDIRVASARIKNLDMAINALYILTLFPQVLEVEK